MAIAIRGARCLRKCRAGWSGCAALEGFKDHGEYEVVKGFGAQKLGHTITAIFDPSADTETGFLSCFAEPQEAAEFLTYKRGR